MAITQSRMLALITIADDFKTQLISTNRTALDLIAQLPPQPSREDLLSTIHALQYLHTQITINPSALETLLTERAHFKLNSQRNTRQMLRARQKRGQDLERPTPKQTAPQSMTLKKSNADSFYGKPAQTYSGAAAQYNKVQPLSDAELAATGYDEQLTSIKIEANREAAKYNMKEPYPDPYNNDELLHPEDARRHGLEIDDSLF